MWKLSEPSANFICTFGPILICFVGIFHETDGKLGVCFDGNVSVGKYCYRVVSQAVNFTTAKKFCRTKGRLASREFLENLGSIEMAAELAVMKGQCVWVGYTLIPNYVSPCKDLNFILRPMCEEVSQFSELFYCVKLCSVGDEWEEQYYKCNSHGYILCEYEKMKPKGHTRGRRRNSSSSVSRKILENSRILGVPLFTDNVAALSMCARLCSTFSGCEIFNFNIMTKQCVCFTSATSVSCRNEQHWEVWTTK